MKARGIKKDIHLEMNPAVRNTDDLQIYLSISS